MKIFDLSQLIIIYFLLGMGAVSAYEVDTHARITEQSYQRSILSSDPMLLQELGIKNTSNAFGVIYYDVDTDNTLDYPVWERNVHSFEKKKMPNEGKDDRSIKGWLMRGAIREDDCYILILCKNPFIDGDRSALTRPLNHFYDPVNDASLGILLGDKAPDWAFGTFDFNASPLQDNRYGSDNHYTLFDAQDSMYRALTGRDESGNTEIGANYEMKKGSDSI